MNASPIGDMTAFFIALNAKIELRQNGNSRVIFLKDFYKGYKDLDMEKGEIIHSISFKRPSAQATFNLEKISKRIHLDIASVNTAILLEMDKQTITACSISAGGVGPTPLFLEKTSDFLNGKELNSNLLKAANDILQQEISPISDVRGTEKYKRLLLRQLFYGHFIKLKKDHIKLAELL